MFRFFRHALWLWHKYTSRQEKQFRAEVRSHRAKTYLWSTESKGKFEASRQIPLTSKFRSVFPMEEVSILPIRKLAASVGSILLLLVGYIVAFSSYFDLVPQGILPQRLDKYSDLALVDRAIEPFFGQSLWTLNAQEIAQAIIQKQGNIISAKVRRNWPNGLTILVTSHPPIFKTALTAEKRPYILTKNGVAIYEARPDEALLALDILDNTLAERTTLDYQSIVSASAMTSIITFLETYNQSLGGRSSAIRLQYFRAENELHILLEGGARILFDLSENHELSIAALRFYIESSGESDFSTATYIDMRNPRGRLFVCRESAPCLKNLTRIYGQRIFDL